MDEPGNAEEGLPYVSDLRPLIEQTGESTEWYECLAGFHRHKASNYNKGCAKKDWFWVYKGQQGLESMQGASHTNTLLKEPLQIKIFTREMMKTLLLLAAMCCVCLALPSQNLNQRKKRDITGTQACGGVLTAPKGVITSPNFPNNYPDNAYCEWNITTTSRIKLTPTNFDLEGYMYLCVFDDLWVYGGSFPRELCGQMLPDPIISTGNFMRIVFKTDKSLNRTGFRLIYEPADSTDSAALTTITTTPTTTRTTPKTTTTTTPTTTRTTPKTTTTTTPTTTRTTPKTTTTTTPTTTRTTPKTTTTTTPTTTRTTPKTTTTTTPTTTRTTTTTTAKTTRTPTTSSAVIYQACGGVLTAPKGVITSPNFPNNYPDNAYCEWNITTTSRIKLTPTNFDLEGYMYLCVFDELWVYGGSFPRELCGQMLPDPIISTGNFMRIVFKTDKSLNRTGFRLIYEPV
ncbi:deleted in malignant brain tumors 1 protein-like [Rana temporaria]|uniref:deleted in malignant brain tumors 1 protein-like n=1 Tax=Rana temporaria TaxID=8407 RepID=UPI001AAC72F4|nr:deleted in malignant brain tumors 1 protein-like [Rana temporaria]